MSKTKDKHSVLDCPSLNIDGTGPWPCEFCCKHKKCLNNKDNCSKYPKICFEM